MDKRDELRAAFNDPTKVVEVAMGFGFNPCLSAKGFEELLARVNDYSWRISELLPYESYAEFLQKQKIHGPYLYKRYIDDDVIDSLHLPYIVTNTGINIIVYRFENIWLPYRNLMEEYKWQDGSFCGKIGKTIKSY